MPIPNENNYSATNTYPYRKRGPQSLTRLWVSIAAFVITLTVIIITSASASVLGAIIFGLFLASLAAGLCYEDSAVRTVICWMASKTINFPMLIWEFSIDGFLWLIGMKILFWVIGVLAGILFGIIGFIIATVIAPFALPFSIVGFLRGE